MKEYSFEDRSEDEINELANEIIENGFTEGVSDSAERIEKLAEATEEYFNNLKILISGEGESYDKVVSQAEAAIEDSVRLTIEAIEGEDINSYIYDAMAMMKGLDRLSEEEMGDEVALFANQDDYTILVNHINAIVTNVNAKNSSTEEEVFEYVQQEVVKAIANWHCLTLVNAENLAEPNLNDQIKEKKQARRDKVGDFARHAGAVALGSLPILGAVFYINNKNKS